MAVLVEQQRPDLLLMQEATAPLDALPALIGGCFHRLPLPGRIHGLATWSPHELTPPSTLALPESRMPGRMPPRHAQVVRIGGITVANVHLSHADGVDDATWLHHLHRGDYTRWFRDAIKDDDLADEAERIRDGADPSVTRKQIREMVGPLLTRSRLPLESSRRRGQEQCEITLLSTR